LGVLEKGVGVIVLIVIRRHHLSREVDPASSTLTLAERGTVAPVLLT
jgi:hypothetical protein